MKCVGALLLIAMLSTAMAVPAFPGIVFPDKYRCLGIYCPAVYCPLQCRLPTTGCCPQCVPNCPYGSVFKQ